MTKFSYEVPIPNMEVFEEDQDFHFALSFLLDNPKYRKHVESFTGFWILDNSFNETQKPETVRKMALLMEKYKPSYVISPDSDKWKTGEVVGAFERLTKLVPPQRVIGIYKTEHEFWRLAQEGCIHFASSYAHRPLMPEWLLKMPQHFLGCLGPQEIRLLKPDTCDTSMPIKLAVEDMTVEKWLLYGCPHILSKPEFFYKPLTPKQVRLAKQNIVDFEEACNG